ncbi:MAG TPA: hypothetical protein VFS00_19560 [Polyangiaceae bacterium]|nr:hypothetical protein [Polyangiaceae bacterium]
MKTHFAFALILFSGLGLVACSGDDDDDSGGTNDTKPCLASSIALTETKVTDAASSNSVIIDFDAKNNASTDYDVAGLSPPIQVVVNVTTSDGTVYESTKPFTAPKLSAGATASVSAIGTYGAGKTYQSYTASLRCDN